MTLNKEILVCERMILVNHFTQPEGRGLQTETRCFPISPNTRYKRLHKQVRKGFKLKEGFDLAYPIRCRHPQKQQGEDSEEDTIYSIHPNTDSNIRWISMSGDHDIIHILNKQQKKNQQDDEEEEFELKIIPSSNRMSMNPFRRGWRKGLGFVDKHGPNILEAISFLTAVYDAVHPAVLRITNGKHHHHRHPRL
ncbi:hypothetical protein BDA99DRAFT_559005 [Phascolomyces articulosus]|uniref:Uncharacterized protein n=1 Tax=Phascolomyces articulosus TaxID=60185 RepID=A0AAD5PEQ8_9FUNG|nr:hypothetical protein BDA99DRAFT_559005 [Phascolomyces articulosus]